MARHVELLLVQDVEHLGRVGDSVRVRTGYARNFLLPRGLAAPATPENVRRLSKRSEERRAQEAAAIEPLRALGERIAQASLTVEAKIGEEGRLYGSVTAANVAQALRAQGFEVEERHVRLEHPIKERGVHAVPIRLHPEVEVEARVWIVEEKPAAEG
jgi:large subunit ribosomal protein L9